MSKQNLSILIYSLAGGGAERVVSVLLHELEEQYDVTLVLMRNKIDYEIPKGTKIHFLEDSDPYENGILKLLKLPYLGWKYKRFCQSSSIDISLAFMNRPAYVSIFAKIFGNKIYTIISERTTPSMMYRADNLLSKVSKILIKKLYPKADFIISNSEGNRLDLIDNFEIEASKIETIYNPFDLDKIENLSLDNVNKFEFTKFTFVTVGRLDYGKNHKLLIDAFSKLSVDNVELIILGEGVLREQLEEHVTALDLGNAVSLLGFDNNPYKYFSKSDAFVFTSLYEGFPNVLVEALACGLPVLSTDCKSGPREILAPHSDFSFQLKEGTEETEYGILIPVNKKDELVEAMNYMIDNFQEKNVKERAKRFDKKRVVAKFINILNRGKK
jgi:N-acetylgalactosamine-N,N'-diacetylbacillosaminyl-diphospho-undecaprenol 4-alpha-N-acetylgalactosaminyltransferase